MIKLIWIKGKAIFYFADDELMKIDIQAIKLTINLLM